MSLAKQPPLGLVQVEDRVVPTTGLAWPDARSLTLSYVPDGVAAGGENSRLFQHLDGQFNGNRAAWQREIAEAYQTWAVEANINVGAVADSGLAMGTAGQVQGDPRFGDIRVGARVLSPDEGDAIAVASGYDLSGSTWTGDALLNTRFQFTEGKRNGRYDLFSVMVHEAGHSLGLEHSSNSNSAMADGYKFRTKLSNGDVTAIRQLYGVRQHDPQDAVAPNNTSSTATAITWTGATSSLSGDLTTTRDADFYKFTTRASGESDVRIRVNTAGLSFLTPNVQVHRNGRLIASMATNDPYADGVSLSLGGEYRPDTTYTIRVAGQGGNVFNRGAYRLHLEAAGTGIGTAPTPVGAILDGGTNETIDTATELSSSGSNNALKSAGSVELPTDVDVYRFGSVSSVSGDRKLFTATVASTNASKLLPIVELVDQDGHPVTSSVIVNESGTFTVEATGVELENVSDLYLIVTPANPAGTKAVGDYTLTAGLRTADATVYDAIANSTLTAATPTNYISMDVKEARLVRFSLDAAAPLGGVPTAVGVTIFDSTGKAVFSFADVAGGYLTTGSVWLAKGKYTIAVTAKTIAGTAPLSVAFDLKKLELGDPVDPYSDDGGSGPTGDGEVVKTKPPTTTPPLPVNDPIADPWAP